MRTNALQKLLEIAASSATSPLRGCQQRSGRSMRTNALPEGLSGRSKEQAKSPQLLVDARQTVAALHGGLSKAEPAADSVAAAAAVGKMCHPKLRRGRNQRKWGGAKTNKSPPL
mmetsp:Transcript_22766/g.63226  ORF Transcript_22766/g.63226 Transcript_22766/m.63226 type:complete len:114 (-) Transcript_22766:2682-3023(-)